MGWSLMHDPERGPLVRRAFEEYATGRFTKEQLFKHVRTWGLTNRRGRPLTSQAIGVLLSNQLYVGIVASYASLACSWRSVSARTRRSSSWNPVDFVVHSSAGITRLKRSS
jgi:hypothetical protein